MKTSWLAAISALVGIAFSGCDFLDNFQRKKNEAEAQIAQQTVVEPVRKEESRQQAKSECAALKHFVSVKLKMLAASRADVEKEMQQLSEDRKNLSKRISEISDNNMADKNGTAATALNMMLKDETVNELAAKYLGEDFAMVRSEFVEKMREALRKERELKEAYERNQAKLERSMSEGNSRIKQARRELSNSVAELKANITRKENRLKSLRSEMKGSKERQRQREIEIRELEREVGSLKTDLQRATRTSSFTKAREDEFRTDQAHRQALREKRDEDERLARQSRNLERPAQIAAEYEQQTVKRLLAELQKRSVVIAVRKNLLDEQVTYLRQATEGIDDLDVAGLKRVREDVDAGLAKKAGAEGENPKNVR